MKTLIDTLYHQHTLPKHQMIQLLADLDDNGRQYLIEKARITRQQHVGNHVYMRGLIELTNYCHQNCLYCGIRKGNLKADRYRLSLKEILACCRAGHALGFRTFVLQGGEDPYYTDDRMVEIIGAIKQHYPDSAITLSIGEKTRASYEAYFQAGADRYLLRHETMSPSLYQRLHPGMSLATRIKCLQDLKEIGYQVGTGFLIGLPGQTLTDYGEDLMFLKNLEPHMVGIGPFMPHQDTPLGQSPPGSSADTITLLAIIRLLLPHVLLPATTALGSIDPHGREKGIKAGANVIMPNLSPPKVRAKYALYDGKVSFGGEAAECQASIESTLNKIGFSVNMSRGDHKDWR